MSLADPYYKVIVLLLLQDLPGCLHIFRSVTPIPLRFQISEVQELVPARQDPGDAPRDLAGDERLTAARTLVVEQNAVGGKNPVALPVDPRHPITVHFGCRIRAARLESRVLILRGRRRAEHFRTGGL